VIKRRLHKRFEEGPEPLSLGGESLTRKPGGEHARQERIQFPVGTLEHLSIEVKLITKVTKEQFFVVARNVRDRIDSRTIETVFRKNDFRRSEDRLAAGLSSSPSSLLIRGSAFQASAYDDAHCTFMTLPPYTRSREGEAHRLMNPFCYERASDASHAFALVSVAAAIDVAGGIAPVPWRAAEAELADAQPLPGNAFKVPLARSTLVRTLLDLTTKEEERP
jgi:hypothetical protein